MSDSGVQIDEKPGNIYRLDNDCLEENFDHLTLSGLVAFGQTSKIFLEVTGQYFCANFVARVLGKHGNIYLDDRQNFTINCFSQYVRKILMKDTDLRIFVTNKFDRLKEIEFYEGKLCPTENLTNVLRNVETVKFIQCQLGGDFHDTFLRYCDQLKRLCVQDNNQQDLKRNNLIGTSDKWLNRKYSTLQHFGINSRQRCDQVVKFLKKNSNIRTFSTTIEFLIANMEQMTKLKIQLNALAILHAYPNTEGTKFNAFVNQLSALQKDGMFEHLHLYFHKTTKKRENIYPIRLMPFVTTLHITNAVQNFTLTPMKNLNQLYLYGAFQIRDLDNALKHLKKLDYIYFRRETIENILRFVGNLPQLSNIQIDSIINDKVVNITAVNNERKYLHNPKNLTIYVEENVYLATKSAFKHNEFSVVDVKRIESYDGFHDFTNTFGNIS